MFNVEHINRTIRLALNNPCAEPFTDIPYFPETAMGLHRCAYRCRRRKQSSAHLQHWPPAAPHLGRNGMPAFRALDEDDVECQKDGHPRAIH
jgi:hypothetical protein